MNFQNTRLPLKFQVVDLLLKVLVKVNTLFFHFIYKFLETKLVLYNNFVDFKFNDPSTNIIEVKKYI